MQDIKICSPCMGISPDSDLGGEVYERELLLRMSRYGARLRIILPRKSRIKKGMLYDSIHYLPLSRRLRWFVSNPLFFHAIKKVYFSGGFDLLRVHSLRYIGPAALLFRRIYKPDIPLIGHHHHIDPELLNNVIDRRVASSLDFVITVSEFSKRQLISEYGLNEGRVIVIYNGVDKKYKPLPKNDIMEKKYETEGKKVLMYIGGLKKRKNLSFLLECLAGVKNLLPDGWICLIFGRGDESNILKKKSAKLGISEFVRFCGYVSERDKSSVLGLCDIFVFPSILEGFGMAAVEAMACGKPVVAINTASLPEIIDHGQTGFLSNTGDKSSYIRHLIYLLKDEDLRQRFGMNGRLKTEKCYSWDESAKKVMECYYNALRGNIGNNR